MTGPDDQTDADLIAGFLRWAFVRAFLHHGWWLATSVYLVVDAGLAAAQLVTVAVAQSLVALGMEVPAGVLADTVSRTWSLVASQALMGTAMLLTGLVTDFAAIVATQVLWGLSWTLAGGADVAWLTGALARPDRVPVVLVRFGRAQLIGSAAGVLVLGGLASLTARGGVMVLAGIAMAGLGLYVAIRFREQRAARGSRRPGAWSTLTGAAALVRRSRVLLLIFAAAVLVNGAGDAFGRLQPLRLIDIGFPADPLLWFTALSVLTMLVGAVALRIVQAHVHDPRIAGRAYGLACAGAGAGTVVLALTPEPVSGASAAVLVAGTADPVARTIGAIWVNEQAADESRATVHSFLAQAEYVGEIGCGTAVAVVAAAGTPAALLACAGLFAATILPVRRIARVADDPV